MEAYSVNIIEPSLFGPYSIHAVPRGTFQKGKHSHLRLKILLGSDVVGYLRLDPIAWQVEPPSHSKDIFDWAQKNLNEIMGVMQKLESGQKPKKIKTTAALHTKAIDAWADIATKDLFVRFSDGKVKKLNMLTALKGLENTWAGEILKPDMFDKVSVKNGMPTWPNEFDFDTDVIYEFGDDCDASKKDIASRLR